MKKFNQGITLIALVITIIVLLILAGVSIVTLTGENGILTKADSAGRETEIAEAKEQAKLDIEEWIAEQLEKGQSANISNSIVKSILTEKSYVGSVGVDKFTTKKNGYEILYADLYSSSAVAKTPKIPEGFYVVPKLDKIEEGFVISDIPNDTTDSGNQFVWIPVTNESEYVRNKTYVSTEVSEKSIDDTNYLPTGIVVPEGKTEGEVEKEMVVKAGGFYVGRYEAGKEDGNEKPISKKEATIWNAIAQGSAKEKAKTFVNHDDVKSGLVTGIQWDVMMAFINGKLDGNGINKYVVTEASSTRHTGISEKSGKNEADRVCNIYDLEGNYYEYIAEKNTNVGTPLTWRGGSNGPYGIVPASHRPGGVWGAAESAVTFRLVLYV